MTKQQFDDLYLGKAVHCDTEEKANEFLELAHGVGYKWYSRESLLEKNYYHYYQEATCYLVDRDGFEYCDKSYYIEKGCEVVEFKQEKENKMLEPVEETFNVGDVVYSKDSNSPLTILRKAWVVCYQDKPSYEHFVEERSLFKTKPLQKITRKELADMGYEVE